MLNRLSIDSDLSLFYGLDGTLDGVINDVTELIINENYELILTFTDLEMSNPTLGCCMSCY